jgi:outer membrane protein assembly factor BamB
MDGIDVQFVIALDKKTGKTVWRTNRSTDFGTRDGDFRKAYTTPIVIDVGGRRQLISVAAVEAMSYDPATGKELWKVRHEGYSEAARPLFAFGMVFFNTGSGSEQMWAVRPDGSGDVTASHVVWKFRKNVSRRSSPILVDDLIYMVSDDGIALCVEAKTGKLAWRQRLGGQYSASPLAADGRIYLFSHEGPATVIAPGREYHRLAVNRLDEGFMASPAVAGQAIFLRTKTDLYRIEK